MFNCRRIIDLARLMLFGAGVALSGCGSESRPTQVEVKQDFADYVKQSCEFTADAGGSVKVVSSTDDIVEGYFGKKYNRTWLDAVSSSSIASTLSFIQTTGARVYRAPPLTAGACRAFESLDPIPSEFLGKWRDAEREMSDRVREDNSRASLSGFYLPTGKGSGEIFVRSDASRWILIHEFMHHNFRTQLSTDGFDVEEALRLQAEIVKQLTAVGQSTELSDEERLKIVVPLFTKMVKNLDLIMVALPFEEIAVEAMLQDRIDSGELHFVPAGAYENASRYIGLAERTAEGLYRPIDQLYNNLTQAAAKKGLYPEIQEMEEYGKIKTNRINQVRTMVGNRKPYSLPPVQSLATGRRTRLNLNGAALFPCPRAEIANAQLLKLSTQLSRLRF